MIFVILDVAGGFPGPMMQEQEARTPSQAVAKAFPNVARGWKAENTGITRTWTVTPAGKWDGASLIVVGR
jgi:hypothetical protein